MQVYRIRGLQILQAGFSVTEINANKTSITCPVCGYTDKSNKLDKETFKCRKCNFTFNV
ncbi:MAG: transposase [Euryarchaeota archaeon]|nr:transposase [Euryarchaeota archaeon]